MFLTGTAFFAYLLGEGAVVRRRILPGFAQVCVPEDARTVRSAMSKPGNILLLVAEALLKNK